MFKIKPIILFAMLTLAFTACGSNSPVLPSTHPDAAVQVEVIALDHAPIRPAVEDVEALVTEYGEKVGYTLYSFDTDEGIAFAEQHDLTEHTPIAIYINGEIEFDMDGRAVKFYSFPQGSGTGVVPDGVWTMDDLRSVLDQETN